MNVILCYQNRHTQNVETLVQCGRNVVEWDKPYITSLHVHACTGEREELRGGGVARGQGSGHG